MKTAAILAAALALAIPPAAAAEAAAEQETQRLAQAAATHKGQGTVHKVDAAAGRFNMSHGPIPSLNWPAMTMDFQVRDKAILKDVKPGQKVEVTIVQESRVEFYVTNIMPVP